MSDNPVSLFVCNYESAARADLQKLEQLHHKGTSALFALITYGSPVLGFICPGKVIAFDTASSQLRRAAYS